MTIKDFRGQVKIQDVQNAFDEIVGRINSQVTQYNSLIDLQDYDITKGAPTLGAANYSLSVGGLKSVLASYDGTVIGCKAFRLDDENVLVSDGFCITTDKVYRINSQVIGGATSPDVRPDPSDSVYQYSCVRSNVGGVYYTGYVNSSTETITPGAKFNALNSIPFEFDKVYQLTAGWVDATYGSSAPMGPYKFAEFNSGLNKVVPIASFGIQNLGQYILGQLPHDNAGDVITNAYPVYVTQSNTDSQTSFAGGYFLYVQKVLGLDNKIKLYLRGKYSSCGYASCHDVYVNAIISDSEGSTAFTELMERCNFIVGSVNSNTDISPSVPYYNYNGTIDEIADATQLGDAHYYNDYRPATGNGIDVSELYFNYRENTVIYKSYEYGEDVVYVDKDTDGNYVLKLESTDEIIQDGGIAKISDLNWAADDVIITGVKNLQLEGVGLKLFSQNKFVPHEGHVWESLDNTDEGKFAAYVIRNITNAGSTGGYCSFMGVDLINSYHSESGLYRKHWGVHPISLIFIPKGFNPTIVKRGAVGQYVYKYTLE